MPGATKKREVRKSVQQPGWITLDGGFAARPCMVQDLSVAIEETGFGLIQKALQQDFPAGVISISTLASTASRRTSS